VRSFRSWRNTVHICLTLRIESGTNRYGSGVLGLERPPRWGIAAVTIAALANAALFTYLGVRPTSAESLPEHPSPAAATSSAALAPSTAAPASAVAPHEVTPVLAVYGDGYSAGSTLGGQADAGWPALVAQSVGAVLRLNAVPRTGYTATGESGQDFAAVAAARPVPDAAVTVVFGSRNDASASPSSVETKAAQTFREIRSQAPGTKLVVIGPAWSSDQVPDNLIAVRDALQAAAAGAGAAFVDPLADHWFGQPEGLIADDGISPTNEGHQYLADLIGPAVAAALAG
jgi:hypothetical protein